MKAGEKIVREDVEAIARSGINWSGLAGKTVLISGAAGSLPSYMVEVLLFLNETDGLGAKVLGIVRNPHLIPDRISRFVGRKGFTIVPQDVCCGIKIDEAVDFIVHAASPASPKYYGSDPVGTLSANIIGTRNMLEVAREKDAKSFLFFSSSEIYGQVAETDIPIREETSGHIDPCNVRSCYAESKRMGETMCVSWFHQYGVRVKMVRPFHTYGPGMRLGDGRAYADFIGDLVAGRDIVMRSDGRARRAFCYLSDAVRGFFMVLMYGIEGNAYNVGNPNAEVSILEFAELLVSAFPEKNLKIVRGENAAGSGYIPSKVSRNCPDIGKIGRLGWGPLVPLREGIIRTVRSFE